MNSKNDLPMTY